MSLTIVDGRVSAARGDPRRCVQPRLHLPEGRQLPRVGQRPDRLQVPLIRRNGELVEAGWDEALQPRSTDCGKWPPTAPPGSASTR